MGGHEKDDCVRRSTFEDGGHGRTRLDHEQKKAKLLHPKTLTQVDIDSAYAPT